MYVLQVGRGGTETATRATSMVDIWKESFLKIIVTKECIGEIFTDPNIVFFVLECWLDHETKAYMKINLNITEKRPLSHYRILQEHHILQLIVVMIEIVLRV